MSGVLKSGWHPKGKDGKSKESWRGDFKGIGQVSGWMGKGKSPVDQANSHVSRPLHTLKDPNAFGPPPKNVNYHGGAALPNQITPDRSGWGAPVLQTNRQQEEDQREAEEEALAEEDAATRKVPKTYTRDTTGLSTSHLPPPPGRRDGATRSSPAPTQLAIMGKPPGLPPRLPPRQNSSPIASSSPTSNAPQADPSRGILNQGALNRLGNAGVSVPGFGIGSKNVSNTGPTSPPLPSRDSSSSISTTSNAQLGELQSRFSRLSSSDTPASETTPAQGTTFAQKQAAFKTASAFRNDPSSISLTDARSAASTANNFRERHGEQVKSGYQSVNKLNAKYGIADKASSYGSKLPSEFAHVPAKNQEPVELPVVIPSPSLLGKKKPPPPPPMKRAGLSGNSVASPGIPPPIPLASKPKPSLNSSHENNNYTQNKTMQAYDLDLSLQTQWYARSPVILPPSIVGSSGKSTFASSSGWTSTGPRKICTYSVIVQHSHDLSRHKIHLTWDASNPGVTVKAQQKYIPPPRALNSNELERYQQSYSDSIASWSESRLGTQVGNGECWTLANEALNAVGANCTSRGLEPCMPSQSLIHGYEIYSFIPAALPHNTPPGSVLEAGVARGDVIQILKAVFKSQDGMRTQFAGDPDHTAVVTEVESDGRLKVVQSNVGGSKNVTNGEYDMSEMVSGEFRIFRVVSQSWIGRLDPTW